MRKLFTAIPFLAASLFVHAHTDAVGCKPWDSAYEVQCWGPWIADVPTKHSEANGDPFTITGGDDSQWIFGIDGTKTPTADVPTSGSATYRGHLWGRAAGDVGGLIFPVTGDVTLDARFGPGVNTRIIAGFTDIQVHRKTTGMNPVDLPNIHLNFDNNSSGGDVNRNGFSLDRDPDEYRQTEQKGVLQLAASAHVPGRGNLWGLLRSGRRRCRWQVLLSSKVSG